MPQAPTTRDRILDALQDLLIDQGERAATLDAVAQRAGVSKGGLLYHFGNKDALIDGLIERVHVLVEADVASMRSAPSGPVEYFIRSSAADGEELDHSFIALARLAQGAHRGATDALRWAQAAWLGVITETVDDPATANAIMLLGDGIYYNSTIGGSVPSAKDMDDLVATVNRLAGSAE